MPFNYDWRKGCAGESLCYNTSLTKKDSRKPDIKLFTPAFYFPSSIPYFNVYMYVKRLVYANLYIKKKNSSALYCAYIYQ